MNLRHAIALLVWLLSGLTFSALAAEEGPTPGVEADLTRTLQEIEAIRAGIQALEQRLPSVDGIDRRIYERRLEREWTQVIDLTHALAKDVDLLASESVEPTRYRAAVGETLPLIDAALATGTQRLQERIRALPMPEPDAAPRELADYFYRRHQLLERLIELLQTRADNLAVLSTLGTLQSTATAAQAALIEHAGETAERISLALEIARDDVAAVDYQLSELPSDEQLTAERSILLARVNQLAELLRRIVPLLDTLQLDASDYRQQVVLSTGQISEDLLDGDIIAGLAAQTLKATTDWLSENAAGLIVKTLLFVLIVSLFWFLSGLASRVVRRAMAASKVNASQLLKDLSARFARHLVLLLGVLIALSQIGVAVAPVLAGLGVAGFIIGFALQDTLSNFASGIMILFYRPFDVGDIVEAGDVFGRVKGMNLVNCTFHTLDNQELVVPNSKIWGGVIRNVTAQTTRRVDMQFGIAYADDPDHAERVLADILRSHPKVLEEPAPVVKLHELADSSVNFVVRPWVQRDDYWDVYWDVTRLVKKRFDEEGLSIPFPQRDVHLFAAAAQAQS